MGRLALFLLLLIPPSNPQGSNYNPAYHSDLYRFSERGVKNAYTSSVIVTATMDNNGMSIGSGNYFHIHGHRFVLTAAHVVEGFPKLIITERSGDLHEANIIYVDTALDIAILKVKTILEFTKPIDYSPSKKPEIGKEIFYCGHPNQMYFTSYHGRISGFNGQYLLLDTFAWPGSSGSMVFNKEGQVVGTVSAISMDAPTGVPVLVPHFVRIGPTTKYTRKFILEILFNEYR